MIHRHREEPVHLRRVQRHRQHPASTRGDQQVGHQAPADGHPGHVLLVRAPVGVVRDHRGDARGGRAPGRVQHQQQFGEMLLDRRAERLDQEDVAFAAVGLQLDFEAIVGEAPGHDRMPGYPQAVAYLLRQLGMGTAAEYRDLSHELRLGPSRGRAHRRRPLLPRSARPPPARPSPGPPRAAAGPAQPVRRVSAGRGRAAGQLAERDPPPASGRGIGRDRAGHQRRGDAGRGGGGQHRAGDLARRRGPVVAALAGNDQASPGQRGAQAGDPAQLGGAGPDDGAPGGGETVSGAARRARARRRRVAAEQPGEPGQPGVQRGRLGRARAFLRPEDGGRAGSRAAGRSRRSGRSGRRAAAGAAR